MRSSNAENVDQAALKAGVGARLEQMPPALRGGGYLDNCTDLESDIEDFQLLLASDIGLHPRLIRLINAIGFLPAIKAWRLLSDESDVNHAVYMPSFRCWDHAVITFLAYPLKKSGIRYDNIIATLKEFGYKSNHRFLQGMTEADYENVRNLLESIQCSPGRKGTPD